MIHKDSEITRLAKGHKYKDIAQLIEVGGFYYHVCEIRIMTENYLTISLSFKNDNLRCWAMYVKSLGEARKRLESDLIRDASLKNTLTRDKVQPTPEPKVPKKRPDYLKLVK